MYTFSRLSPSSIEPFSSFFPEKILKKITAEQDPGYTLITFGACDNHLPIGAGSALLNDHLHYLEILHIEVEKSHRNHHIGRTLIAKIQEAAIEHGAKIFSLIYPQNAPETPAIEKILQANHWRGSRPFMIQCYFDALTFDAPWVHFNYRYPKGYQEFRWKYLSKKERENLEYRQKQGHFPQLISPFREENQLENLNSLGLKYEKRIVGWIITHRIDSETIRYSSLYIEPSLQFRGLAIKLLANSILLHMKAPTQRAYLEIPLLHVHYSWIQFIKKRILPHAIKTIYLQQGWHTL